jgi:hypothetical protein
LNVLESVQPQERDAVAETLLQSMDPGDRRTRDAIRTVVGDEPCGWSKLKLVASVGEGCRPELQLPEMKERLAQLFTEAPGERAHAIKRLVQLLTTAHGASEHVAFEYAVDELVARYKASPDEAILDAFDSVTFDAGNGVQLCRFFRETFEAPGVIEHYRKPGATTKNIRRCRLGSGISEEICVRMLGAEGPECMRKRAGLVGELWTIAETPGSVSEQADAFSTALARLDPYGPQAQSVIGTLRELDDAGYGVAGVAVLGLYGNDPCKWGPLKRAMPSLDEIDVPCRPFLAQDFIDRRLAEIRGSNDERRKEAIAGGLLAEVRGAQTSSELSIVHKLVQHLIEIYRSTRSAGVLSAIDSAKTDGSVGTTICGFYRSLRNDEEYVKLVQQDAAKAAAASRCLGGKVPGSR